MSLEPADYVAIGELTVRYGQHYDDGDGDAWAALFAPDGRFFLPDGTEIVGTVALAALPAAGVRRFPGIRHFGGAPALTVDGEHVQGRSYMQAQQLDGDGRLQPLMTGEYHDVFARVDGAWRFAQRRIVLWLPPPAPSS
jgi:hypothetical protein